MSLLFGVIEDSDGADGDVVATIDEFVINNVFHVMGFLVFSNKGRGNVTKTHVFEIVFAGAAD